MPRLVRTRLSVMMFLFYFAVGSWAVTLSTYLMSVPIKGGLNLSTTEVGWVYSTFAFGGMLAPLLIGLLADRLFAAERVLGVTGLACAALMFAVRWWCDANFPHADDAYRRAAAGEVVAGEPALEQLEHLDAEAGVASTPAVEPLRQQVRAALDRANEHPAVRRVAATTFGPLFGLMLAYCVSLQIGLTLTTVIALRNLPDPAREFSRTRVYGTFGWIVAGNAIALFLVPVSTQPLYLAAGASALLGTYAFTLPRTPPKGAGRTPAESLGLPALRMFKDRSFGVFVAVALVCTAMNQFYAVYAHRYLTDLGVPRPEQVLTLGQVCEMACMFAIPYFDPRRRLKVLMLLGLGGWTLRGAVLAWGHVPAVVAVGVPMHGWSYAFFYTVAATYLDQEAPPHLRASAQGIITFVAGGVGVWAGNTFAGLVVDHHRVGTIIDWRPVWSVPLAGSAAAMVVFMLLFRPHETERRKGVRRPEVADTRLGAS
jgi:nucleoside transporter